LPELALLELRSQGEVETQEEHAPGVQWAAYWLHRRTAPVQAVRRERSRCPRAVRSGPLELRMCRTDLSVHVGYRAGGSGTAERSSDIGRLKVQVHRRVPPRPACQSGAGTPGLL